MDFYLQVVNMNVERAREDLKGILGKMLDIFYNLFY
jgi:hypothetical protein